jgi:hypothetical protein
MNVKIIIIKEVRTAFIVLMMEALRTSETSAYSESTWRYSQKTLIFILAT